jgi:hypothetical protein
MNHVTSRTWTPEDVRRLRNMVEEGVSATRAAVVFRRTTNAVKMQAKKIGYPLPR